MRTKINFKKSIVPILLGLLSLGFARREFDPASANSFYNVIENLTWANPTEATDLFTTMSTCKQDLVNKLKAFNSNSFNFRASNAYNTATNKLFDFLDSVEQASKDHEFEAAKENRLQFLENWKRYKILNVLPEKWSASAFENAFKAPNTDKEFTDEEKATLVTLYRKFRSLRAGKFIVGGNITIGDCQYDTKGYISVLSMTETLIEWGVTYRFNLLTCECNTNGNPFEVEKSDAALLLKFSSTIRNNDYRKMLFNKPTTNAEYLIATIKCCNGSRGERLRPGEDKVTPQDPDEDNDDSDDNKDDDDDNSSGKDDDDCCDIEQPTQTIGFSPGVALTDNFENFSYDVAIEYTRNFGNTIGNNTFYAGARAGYMEQNAQDGEVKETMFYGSVFGENRTPISECGDVQWVNGLNLQYASGSIDAFGNEDDLSAFNFGIHTGFNFQLSNNLGIGANINVLNFGTITYESENGMEFEQEVGDFTLNKFNRANFTIRFRF